MDRTNDSYGKNNIGDFRSRAYVNPCIVKCAVAYANAGSLSVPKKIHINPNFKGRGTFLLNDKSHEPSSVHINPYFARSKVDSPKIEPLPKTPSLSYNKLNSILAGDERSGGPDEKEATSRCVERGNTVQMASTPAMCSQKVPLSTFALSQPNIADKSRDNNFGSRLDIKTRHKIVHIDNSKLEKQRNENSNRKLLNRYKLINVKKSEINGVCDEISNCVPGRGRNLVLNSESHPGRGKVEKIPAENLKLKLRRNSAVNKITNSIKTKYIYHNKTIWQRKKTVNLLRNSKHRLDKREMISDIEKPRSGLNACRSQKKIFSKNVPQHRIKTTSCLWKPPFSRHKYGNHFIWRKEGKSENDVPRMKKSYPNRTVVKIGEIMYKSSSNKLTRAKDKKREMRTARAETFPSSRRKHRVVYVRGEKFLLDSNGKTIVRQSKIMNSADETKSSIRRIDLGGVTFIQKSSNVLIRTNTHQARQLVHSAKQKSIALLRNLRKRNNMPCLIYQRFGICRRHESGICIYVHDPKNIDLCKRFLRGECNNAICPLSHDVVKEKMETCHFFLKGKCSKENCQYLHVKVNKKAVICRDFLRGFCDLGQNCKKRHVHRCPELDETGSCSRGVACPYPHGNISGKKTKLTTKSSEAIPSAESDLSKLNSRRKVYRKRVKKDDSRTKSESSKKRNVSGDDVRRFELTETCGAGNESVVECIPKRVKLTDLPLFIPLKVE